MHRTTTKRAGNAALMLLLAGCGAASNSPVPSAAASQDMCFDEGEAFEGEARLYIEHNATDADTGVHGTFDQEGLAAGCVMAPDGTPIILIDPSGNLDPLGINQLFFESREPPNDEYSIDQLKADFPEGEYRISGVDFEGTRRVGTARLTHAIPAPPTIVAPEVVSEDEADANVLPTTGLTVRWEPVAETVDGAQMEIVGYEVIVTKVDHDAADSLSRPEYDVHLPPATTDLAVPDGFLEAGTLYELEVLAIEESGNQTITLGFFTTE